MVKEIVVCGDSFGCGYGLEWEECFEKSFGGLVAEHFKIPLKVLARSGCCNYVIYLQVEKIIHEYLHKRSDPFVLVTVTNHARSVFPSDYVSSGYNHYTLEDVDYTSHMPYSDRTGKGKRDTPYTMADKPKLISDTVSNFWHYLFDSKSSHLFSLFSHLGSKLKAIKIFYQELYDESIKENYDNALIMMMHMKLKEVGIPHLIMSPSKHQDRFIEEKSYFLNNWGEYCQKYPDAIGSGHCDERGHREVADKLIKRIEETI